MKRLPNRRRGLCVGLWSLAALFWSSAALADSGVWVPTDEPEAKVSWEYRFALGTGLQRLDMGPLNAELQEMGAQSYSDWFFYRPMSLGAEILFHGNALGFEARSLDNPESDAIKGGFQNNVTFFTLELSYSRVLFATSYFRARPVVSLGLTELHCVLQPHAPDGVPFADVVREPRQSTHLVTNAYTASLGLALEFPLWLWGDPGTHEGGFAPGVRGGYVFELAKSASDDTWVQHGQQVPGGPALPLSGPFVQIYVALVLGE